MQHPPAEREGGGDDIVMGEMKKKKNQKVWEPRRTPGSSTTRNTIWEARAPQERTFWT